MKRTILCLMAALLCVTLTSCASKDNNMAVNPGTTITVEDGPAAMPPEGTDSLMPEATMAPEITGSAADMGVNSPDAARRVVEQIEDELERLSEVTDAQVIAAGNTAVVALRFDSQYRAGVDERMKKMVEERVKGVAAGLTHVYVTGETEHFNTLNDLGDRLESAADLTDIRTELKRLVDMLTAAA